MVTIQPIYTAINRFGKFLVEFLLSERSLIGHHARYGDRFVKCNFFYKHYGYIWTDTYITHCHGGWRIIFPLQLSDFGSV